MKINNKTCFNYLILIIIIFIFVIFLLFILLKFYNEKTLEHFGNSNNKYVCIYACYEKNQQYIDNINYFINYGGILDNIDYYFVVNGNSTIKYPVRPNIKVIYRENKGFDFGAWEYIIKNNIQISYDYYIFINSSVRGPYNGLINNNWLNSFLELFNSGKDIKIVGTSINILDHDSIYFNMKEKLKKDPPYTHIQSMFFILNNEGFNYLNDYGFFDDEHVLNSKDIDINYVVANKEITMSQLILDNGWNINCILPKYRDIDYRNVKSNFNFSGSDPYFKGSYFNNTIQPDEVIFYKISRLN